MDRKKTNSVTELVKIIAREIIEERSHNENLSTTATMEVLRIAKGEYWRMEEKVKMWVIKFVSEEMQYTEKNTRVWAREFLKNELKEQENNFISETICKVATKHIEGIDNELKSVGHPWPVEEDVLLQEEMDVAINRIATNHGRTTGSIRSRIRQKEVLKSQRREENE